MAAHTHTQTHTHAHAHAHAHAHTYTHTHTHTHTHTRTHTLENRTCSTHLSFRPHPHHPSTSSMSSRHHADKLQTLQGKHEHTTQPLCRFDIPLSQRHRKPVLEGSTKGTKSCGLLSLLASTGSTQVPCSPHSCTNTSTQ